LEAVTAYTSHSYDNYVTHRYFGVFDFSLGEDGEWLDDVAIDFSSSEWQNNYQLGFEPNYYYYVRIMSDPDLNGWTVQLWNKVYESWQQVFPEEGGHDGYSGGPRLDNGWDMFETYTYNESWPGSIPQIRSKDLCVYTRSWASGDWYYYWSYAYAYECASELEWNWNPSLSYEHDFKYAYYEWYVGTAPTYYVDDIYWYGGWNNYCVENPDNLIGIADASYVHMHCCKVNLLTLHSYFSASVIVCLVMV
jgi:hypothetical protein